MSVTQDTNTALPAQAQPSAGPAAPITSPKPAGRMVQLDVLRGVAILLVMGRHFAVSPTQAGWLSFPAGVWYVFGWTGVDLFFVLSGFLVGGLLLGELRKYGRLDVFRFIIRRIFKIWPAYYVLVLGSIAIHA
ncbi:MAG: acyltransferase family protein, partial [Tepidisphaeraceae bacterium]